ncbi:non-ribosomal peptide synthetase [Streptomyces cinnamoneus]|uniref:non-ribosomal peptide synthetase n=1 Tax=Streptomyces cinnamoneus TaxID=53446 RepID=UPI003426358A
MRAATVGTGPLAGTGSATVPELLARTARRTPDAPALITREGVISHRELDAHVERLARVLHGRGLGAGHRVAVLADRSWQAVTCPLAVLRAGAAYVPLDPAEPPERLRDLVARISPAAVLGRAEPLAGLSLPGVPAIPADHPAPEPGGLPGRGPSAGDLAYAMFTSGSTGAPKAVLVPHRAVAAATASLADLFDLGPADRVLHWTSLLWDTSGEEIYPALVRGAALVVDDRVEARSVPALLAVVREHEVTVVDLSTAMWNELVEHLASGDEPLPPSLRLVVIGGEAAQARAVRRWSERVPDHVRLLNTYGQTETVMVTHAAEIGGAAGRALDDDGPVPIGRPLPHVRQSLMARTGEVAELWIGGPGVSWGYADRPDLTAAAFLPEPDGGGARRYRTGDLVRELPGGALAHAGRVDQQVKIRGVRVEPGEVERAMTGCPGVAAAAVVTVGEDRGQPRLVGAYVPSETAPATEQEVAGHCARRLSRALLPHRIAAVAALPLLRTGKVDRAALRSLLDAAPVAGAEPSPGAAPETAGQETAGQDAGGAPELASRIAGLCGRALGCPCGPDDSLFALGGDSLTVTRLISQLYRETGAELTFRDVFDHPSPRELALLIEGSGGDHR